MSHRASTQLGSELKKLKSWRVRKENDAVYYYMKTTSRCGDKLKS